MKLLKDKEEMCVFMEMNAKNHHKLWYFMGYFCGSIMVYNWEFPEMGVPQNGWFVMENPMKMDDLEIPQVDTPIFGNL